MTEEMLLLHRRRGELLHIEAHAYCALARQTPDHEERRLLTDEAIRLKRRAADLQSPPWQTARHGTIQTYLGASLRRLFVFLCSSAGFAPPPGTARSRAP